MRYRFKRGKLFIHYAKWHNNRYVLNAAESIIACMRTKSLIT